MTYDPRDYRYAVNPAGLPDSVSLKEYAGAIDNQLSANACTAHALTSAMELLCKRGGLDVELSRLFVYYNARPDPTQDTGSNIRESIKTLCKIGVPLETFWPYDINKVNVKPSDIAYACAAEYRIERYSCTGTKLDADNDQRKAAIAQGFPVVIAMRMDSYGYVGDHAMCIVGYDQTGFVIENSWGEQWGEGGYFTLPYADATRLVDQSWVIEGVLGVKVEPLWVPSTTGSRVFLEPYDVFKLSNANARVYGAQGSELVLLKGATDASVDQNVTTVSVPYSSILSYQQAGNQLWLYADQRCIMKWSVGRSGFKLISEVYPMPITIDAGQMTIDGKALSQSGPLRWEDM